MEEWFAWRTDMMRFCQKIGKMKPMDDVLDDFLERLDEGEPFAISRWGDGEYRLIQKTPLMRTDSSGSLQSVVLQPLQ